MNIKITRVNGNGKFAFIEIKERFVVEDDNLGLIAVCEDEYKAKMIKKALEYCYDKGGIL